MRGFDYETCSLNYHDAYIDMERVMYMKSNNPMDIENERIVNAVRWATKAADAIHAAGGSARLLNDFPDKLIATMVRNSINLSRG